MMAQRDSRHSYTSQTVNLHGHRMTLSVFQGSCEAEQMKRCVQRDGSYHERTMSAHDGLRLALSSSTLPLPRVAENCTKPIKEDTVAFHAA